MARRINPSTSSTEGDDGELPMPGPTPELPEEVAVAPVVTRHQPDPVELAKLPAHKIYRVMREGKILYGGVPSMLKAGKMVSDATHDLASLRAQGIMLEEISYGG